jgi:prepilin-type N-terminal cleavage/methylation domain-containing protein
MILKPAPLAWLLRVRIRKNRNGGFTLIEIMVVVAIIGLLAAIAIPSFMKSRDTAQLNSIFNNLRTIEAAKDQWALESKKGTGDTTSLFLISDYLKGGTIKPVVTETYTTNPVGTPAFATSLVPLGTYAAGDPISAQ